MLTNNLIKLNKNDKALSIGSIFMGIIDFQQEKYGEAKNFEYVMDNLKIQPWMVNRILHRADHNIMAFEKKEKS